MLFINKKYKPMITKQTENKEDKRDFVPIQGKGLNELIEKVKDILKELTKKKKLSSNSKISFN